ncbi:MAG: Flp family type IVb pilin [Coriobacteriia bacterium]|nr:Flp family type IVb pilin [Coriobacteriia bacterium]
MRKMGSLIRDSRGQGMIEYAVIIGVVIVVAVALVILFGSQIEALFDSVTSALGAI